MLESIVSGLASDRLLERLAHLRERRTAAFATAAGIVALATLIRWLLDPYLQNATPFLTYFIGVLLVALIAGLGPALAAIAASAVIAWYLFIPPRFSFDLGKREAVILGAFVGAAAAMALVVALMNAVVERLLQQRQELISLRERDRQLQRLMIAELQHRTANLMSHVKVLAARSFGSSAGGPDNRLAFLDRIDALAASIQLGVDGKRRTLAALLEQVLKPYRDRIAIEGCELELTDEALQHFALIAHELQSNAVKHGALSSPRGRVEITGRIDSAPAPAQFQFVWQEREGPPVTAPQRKGFGMTTLVKAAEYRGATVSLAHDPGGVCYRYSISLARIVESGR